MGLTLTGVPLVTELLMVVLPAVIAPVPPENTAVRLELCPEVMVVGLAVKLVIVGVVPLPLAEPPQPDSAAKPKPRNTVAIASTTWCLTASPSTNQNMRVSSHPSYSALGDSCACALGRV